MIDLLYRVLYRRERRERRERGAAIAEVWRQRQVENDARWERQRQRMQEFRQAVKSADSWEQVEQLLADFRRAERAELRATVDSISRWEDS